MEVKKSEKDEIKRIAEGSLVAFITLVHPNRLLGAVHKELIQWWTREDAKSHQLTLLPRDHMKSALIAYRVAWEITKNPAIRVMYVSSTAGLAIKQVKFIKDILTCDKYRQYWPEMIQERKSEREKWAETQFSVDHPKRKEENVRDATVFAAGLTTTITGLHCDIAVLDDVVVMDNAYTAEGRDKVERQYSFLASIEASDAREWAVGTRYHPKDLYANLLSRRVTLFDSEGEIIEEDPLFEVFERKVETAGDGTGEFLWPRQMRSDGKFFGFDQNILAKKKAQYIDQTQFRAQYYNDPNDLENAPIKAEYFLYYDPKHIQRADGKLYYKGSRLNVFAAIDFAYSLRKEADFTTIVVIGVSAERKFYVLEIDRFKSKLISDYFQHILRLFQKWDFRTLRAEVTAAQEVIVEDLRANYIRPYGLALTIDKDRPIKDKDTKILSILQNRYKNGQIYHYVGGNCQILEEELVLLHPAHDDVKDALSAAVDVAIPPSAGATRQRESHYEAGNRFGGFL